MGSKSIGLFLIFLFVCSSYKHMRYFQNTIVNTKYIQNNNDFLITKLDALKNKQRKDESWNLLPMNNQDVDLNDNDDDIGYQNTTFKSGFITIVGNPNVGKSTLMNSILGEKLSIVSPKPQTTRHRILGVVTEKVNLFFCNYLFLMNLIGLSINIF